MREHGHGSVLPSDSSKAMNQTWHLDAHNPFEDTFEEALLNETLPPLIAEMVLQNLVLLLQRPTAGDPIDVGGQSFRVLTTQPFVTADETVPALVIVYRLDPDHRLIQPVFVGRAAQIRSIERELRGLAAPEAGQDALEREILYPIDPTSIPKKKIEDAVLRALRRPKAS